MSPEYGCLRLGDLSCPIDFDRLFPRVQPLELEIGAGRGDFLESYARAHPNLNIVAVERNLPVLRRTIKKVERAGLDNAVIINAEIIHLLQEYIPPHSLSAIHVYFPDPWPKRRHAKRRIFQPDVLRLMLSALKPGGALHIRTDVSEYYEAILRVAAQFTEMQSIEPPEDITCHLTAFEKRFVELGMPIYRRSYRLTDYSPSSSSSS